jgi:inward rectifier potassium channel
MDKYTNLTEEQKYAENIGYGTKFDGATGRLVNDNGEFNIKRLGETRSSLYAHMIKSKWRYFFGEVTLAFLLINILFGLLYYLHGAEHISCTNGSHGGQNFLNAVYFSIQTFTSVGYGACHPTDNFTNIVASINAFVGLLAFALITGLLFARFSRVRDYIKLSENMITSPLNDENTLQFRMVNAGKNTMINMKVSASYTWLVNENGHARRKFQRLPFQLDFIMLFPINWTLVHTINEQSPFFNKRKEDLENENGEILLMIKGYDDTHAQEIFKVHSYHATDLVENARFLPMYKNEVNHTVLDMEALNKYVLL